MQDKKKRRGRREEERKKIYMKIDSHFLRSLETAAPALAPLLLNTPDAVALFVILDDYE